MQLLRFLLKLAFICNCCYLLLVVLQRLEVAIHLKALEDGLADLGLLVAPCLNASCILLALLLLLLRRLRWKQLPPWIFIVNIVILSLQIFL